MLALATALSLLPVASATASSPIAALKSLVQEQHSEGVGEDKAAVDARMFHIQNFEENGSGVFELKVHSRGVQVPMPLASQRTSWLEYKQEAGARKNGLAHWMPGHKGIFFQSADKSKLSNCVHTAFKPKSDHVAMTYSCETMTADDAARFGVPQVDYGCYVDPEYEDEHSEGGKCGCTSDECSCHTVWNDCKDGCPYGYDCSSWGSWDFPYYAMTQAGFWGCPGLDQYGYCSKRPHFYPFYSDGYYAALHDKADEQRTGLPEKVKGADGGTWFRGT